VTRLVSAPALVATIAIAIAGCAQIFGLDETHDVNAVDAAGDGIDAPGVCDPVAQTNCDPDACDVDPDGMGAVCRPAGQTGPLGSCMSREDCAPGTTCLLGVCRSFCASAADCTGAQNDCHLSYFVTSVCDSLCDVRDSSGGSCGAGFHCELASAPDGTRDFGAYCVPGPGGTIADGGPCQTPDECVAGTTCLTTDGINFQCLRWCYTNDPNTCMVGQCVPVQDGQGPIVVHGNELGACAGP